jgi:polyhydroxyalkanoate synthesis repressor PhaR
LSDTQGAAPGPIIIKKYANRRLYNTETSSYVTLDHLCEMVKEGTEFEVRDARTGEDITRQVLAQIIFEEENKGQHLLPIQFLRQLIRFYGDSMQAFVPSYLEMSMESFTKNQQDMREKFAEAMGGKLGFKDFQDLTRQNMAAFERAMKMFTPFAAKAPWTDKDMPNPFRDMPNPFAAAFGASAPKPNGAPEPAPQPRRDEEIKDLKDQIAAMRAQIADLAKRS